MIPAQTPSGSMGAPAPAYSPAPARGPDWKARGGLVKMVGFIIEGVGIVVAGMGLHYMIDLINSNGSNTNSIYTNLFNTLEAGVVIGGIGVIVIGIGVYLAARQS